MTRVSEAPDASRPDATDRPSRQLRIGEVMLDPAAHLITVRGQALHFALREFHLLELLMRNADRVLDNATILERVWGTGFQGDPSTLTVHVLRIRKKLEHLGAGRHLRTVRGVGYVFDTEPVVEVV
jgi:DNA-binding response OmpR family regulator